MYILVSTLALCIRIVSSDHPTDLKQAPSLPLPLRLSVSVSSLQIILRIQSRHLLFLFIFIFVSLYPHRLFRPSYGYKVNIPSSFSSLCTRIVSSDHSTDTEQAPSLPLRLSVSVTYLQTILQIQRRHLLFLDIFVSLYLHRCFIPPCGYKEGTFPSSSSLFIRIVVSDHLTDTKQAPSLPLCLSVSVSFLKIILRIQSRHLVFIFVSLNRYRFLRPFHAYKVDISSSSSSLCIGIVSSNHYTNTNQTSYRPHRLSVSVSFLQTNIRIISRHLLFHFLFASLYSYRLFNHSTG